MYQGSNFHIAVGRTRLLTWHPFSEAINAHLRRPDPEGPARSELFEHPLCSYCSFQKGAREEKGGRLLPLLGDVP